MKYGMRVKSTYCWKILPIPDSGGETFRDWNWESKKESVESLQRGEPENDDGDDVDGGQRKP